MVEIREESSEPHYSGSTNTHSRARQEGESDPNVGVSALVSFLHKSAFYTQS